MWSRGTESMQHVRDLRRAGARPCLPLDSPATCPGTRCVVRPLAPVPINERRAVVHALAFDTPLQAGHRDVYMMHMRHKTYQHYTTLQAGHEETYIWCICVRPYEHYTTLQAGHEETYIWCICVRPYEHYAHFENKRKNDSNNNHIVQHLKKKNSNRLTAPYNCNDGKKIRQQQRFHCMIEPLGFVRFFFSNTLIFNFTVAFCSSSTCFAFIGLLAMSEEGLNWLVFF